MYLTAVITYGCSPFVSIEAVIVVMKLSASVVWRIKQSQPYFYPRGTDNINCCQRIVLYQDRVFTVPGWHWPV